MINSLKIRKEIKTVLIMKQDNKKKFKNNWKPSGRVFTIKKLIKIKDQESVS